MPRRKGGLFLPLDVGFPDDDRIVEAGERPAWLYLCMALASKRLGTDGLLTARQVERLHVSSWQARLAELVRVGLVLRVDDGTYGIAAWRNHNDPIALVRERQAKDAERKRTSRPNGLRTETGRTPGVEKREEEKSTSDATGHDPSKPVALHVVAAFDEPCEMHMSPAGRFCSGCAADAKALA